MFVYIILYELFFNNKGELKLLYSNVNIYGIYLNQLYSIIRLK